MVKKTIATNDGWNYLSICRAFKCAQWKTWPGGTHIHLCMHGWILTLAIMITISTLASMALMLAILGGFGQTNGEARKGDNNKTREEDGGCAWDESKDQIMTVERDDVCMGDCDLLTVMTMSPKKKKSILQWTRMLLMESIRALVNIPKAQTHSNSFIKVRRWIRSQYHNFQTYVKVRLANWGMLQNWLCMQWSTLWIMMKDMRHVMNRHVSSWKGISFYVFYCWEFSIPLSSSFLSRLAISRVLFRIKAIWSACPYSHSYIRKRCKIMWGSSIMMQVTTRVGSKNILILFLGRPCKFDASVCNILWLYGVMLSHLLQTQVVENAHGHDCCYLWDKSSAIT